MDQPPKPKSPDELRAEELRRAIAQAAKENREAKAALEALQKGEASGGAQKQESKQERETKINKWGPLPQSPYMALGVLPEATEAEVKTAHREMVKKYFPDQPGLSPEEKKEAEEWMKVINEAREALTNPNFTPTYFKEYARLRIKENAGERDEEVRIVRRQDDRIVPVPPPPRPPRPTPTPTPIPKAPEQSFWNRWKRRILIGLGLAVAGGVGTEVTKRAFQDDKEPTPAVSPATNAEFELRARMTQLEAQINAAKGGISNQNIMNVERRPRSEKRGVEGGRSATTTPDVGATEEAVKLKAQMAEMTAKHQAELDAAKALREKLQADMDARAKAETERAARDSAETAKKKPGMRLPGGNIRIVDTPQPDVQPVIKTSPYTYYGNLPPTPPGGIFNNPAYAAGEREIKEPVSNPYFLSPEEREKASEKMTESLEKLFPVDTLDKEWKEIKDQNAYRFMSTREDKVKDSQKPLLKELKKIRDEIGLPTGGIKSKETIEQYLERAAQKEIKDAR